MKLFILIFVAVAIRGIKSNENEDLECKGVTITTVSRRLKDHLFCEYDSYVRPGHGTHDSTLVDVRMIPQYVEFSEEQNILHLHTWLSLAWPDSHLTWEPSKWENVKELHVASYEIWKPDLTVFNAGDMDNSGGYMPHVDCLVTFNGTVKCVLPMKLSSHCPTDYSEWPYDKHNCTLQIGAWIFYHDEILLKFETDALAMHSFMPNKQWHVHIEGRTPGFTPVAKDEGDLMIFVTVLLQRHGSRLAIIYILPAIVLMVLTLIVMWLDSQSTERILIACINFICHILGIFDLHWYFPASGSETTPKILVFYEVSVGLAASALILTCLLRKLRHTNVTAPMWLTTGTTLILNSPVGAILRMNITEHKRDTGILEDDENNGQMSKNPKDRTWQELAIIIECFSLVICFLIYLIMLTIVLPPGSPKKVSPTFWFF